MNLSKNHQIPLSKIYICLCQKKHIYPYQKFAFTFIFFLHFILTGTKNDLKYFPEIEYWFSSILENKDYIVKVYEDFYYILRKSKNKICRVEKINNNANLSDILEKIRLELQNPISVIVPIDKDNVVIAFKNNGFKIKKHLLNKYMEGRNCYFMMEG